MKPCGHLVPVLPLPPFFTGPYCRICELYETRDDYRALWDGLPAPLETPQSLRLDCIHLGKVLDRLDCNCQRQWVRQCDIHQATTLNQCEGCKDYEL